MVGSFYLICTAVFSILSGVIGLRMIGLSRRTGQMPEFLLGFGLILTAAVGYGLLITVSVLRAGAADPHSAGLAALTMIGKMSHNAGVMCNLGFVLLVFRNGVSWAKWLAGFMSAVLWIGFGGVCLTGGIETGLPQGVWYWVEFSVIGTYPIWTCIEALRYYTSMRKRGELGLADPLVVNRFLLWGIAASLSFAAIWTVTAPSLLTPVGLGPTTPFMQYCLIATSIFGTACVSMYWMTFFPPNWYVARINARAAKPA